MTVIVGYVPTETGFLAVREAEREAASRNVPLLVVNVIGAANFATPTAADEQALDALAQRLTESGHPFEIEQPVETGSVADVLLLTAARRQATLIVLGLHRRSRVQKALLGSTTQSVILAAECPVLTVPNVDD